MPRDHDTDARMAAERRVREVQERQMASLIRWQEKERAQAFSDQALALGRLAEREAALREERRLAHERLEREWQQQRDRLGAAPASAPVFDLGGARPQRNLHAEYERLREGHAARKKEIAERLDERLADVGRERENKLETFQKANQAMERDFAEDRARKAEEQQHGFEILVHRQMQRGEPSPKREFARSSRAPEREL